MYLLLGPIIGFTDTESTRIWVRASGAVENLRVRVDSGHGLRFFRFESTEATVPPRDRIFNTGVCTIRGLKPGMRYRFDVVEGGGFPRTLASGSVRTVPPPNSRSAVTIVSTSCSGGTDLEEEYFGWPHLRDYIADAEPDYLVLTGDQVYTDARDVAYNVWKHTLHSGSADRLRAFADLYQSQWGRTSIREVMASLPVAMMWDDHELRDGWGSRPGDTDALVNKYPKGKPIYELFQAYYRDARTAFWHFQRCHGPIGPFDHGTATRASRSRHFGQWITGAPYVSLPTIARKSTVEYWFDVGAARVVMFDGRSARDYFLEPPEGAPGQPVNRVHGDKQWKFVTEMLRNLPRTTRAVVPVTSVPIVMNATDSVGEWFVGDYEPDVAEFKRGDLDAMLKTFGNLKHPDSVASGIEVVVTINWSDAQVEDLMRESVDDLRDGWQSARNLDEAGRLLRLFGALHVPGRPGTAMPVTFLGGDIHIGGLFEIRLAGGRAMQCAIGSAIAKEPPGAYEAGAVIGTEVDYPKMSGTSADGFLNELRLMNPTVKSNILRGIRAELQGDAIPVNNYAVTRIEFGTEPAAIHNDIIPTREDAELTRIYARLGPFSISTM